MTDFDWCDNEDGQFINLRALTDFQVGKGPDLRLPDWETIREHLPQLIHPADMPGDRYFISHRWDDAYHPDPSGWQLNALTKLASHYQYQNRNIAIWYDFMSLPQQRPRSGDRGRIFSAGLENIRRTVGRCEIVCLISQDDEDKRQALGAMLQRGWIVFELYIARSQMKRPLPLYQKQAKMIDYGRAQHDWDAVVPDVQAYAPTDTPELLLQWLTAQKIVCTNGSDLKLLARLLHSELNTHDRSGHVDLPAFDTEVVLSNEVIREYALLNASGRSLRFPELFLDPGHSYDPITGEWMVVFKRRPPLPPWGSNFTIPPNRLAEWAIDPKTGISRMYPGIRFDVAVDGAVVGFSIRSSEGPFSGYE